MRQLSHFTFVTVLVLAGLLVPPRLAQADSLDTAADLVFGQPDFTSNTINDGGLNAGGLSAPGGLALDQHGNLYIADGANNRVLEFDAPLSSDHAADRVFGQQDMTSNAPNQGGGPTASRLWHPTGVALDEQGNLYIADYHNNRVLEYDTPLTADRTADRVFGQSDFSSNDPNRGGPVGANSLYHPAGVALDREGNLYVADTDNHRVLEFDIPLGFYGTADHEIGQNNFLVNLSNGGGSPSDYSLSFPTGVALDAQDNLYVADFGNNRVLEYDHQLPLAHFANRVFGQPNFTSAAVNNPSLGADSLSGPHDVVLDGQGNLYVADYTNNRTLEYDAPLTAGASADLVFGQLDMTHNGANQGGSPSANGLSGPAGLAVDGAGNLYSADSANNRVLEYDLPVAHSVPALTALSTSTLADGSPSFILTVNGAGFVTSSIVRWNGSNRPTTFLKSTQLNAAISASDIATGGPLAVTVFTPGPGGGTSTSLGLSLYARAGHDITADQVLGQPNFTTNGANSPLMSRANRLAGPGGLAVDTQSGRLFVADADNNRVLSWPNVAALANGQPADLVLGQLNFLADSPNNGGVSANSLWLPSGVALDDRSNVYVADYANNRVLEFDNPLTHDTSADRVFGQPDFTHNTYNQGGVTAASLSFPFGVAVDRQGNLYVAD